MAEQDKVNIVASGDDKDVAKLENMNGSSFEFSMVRRRSLDEVRCILCLSVAFCPSLSQFMYVKVLVVVVVFRWYMV